MQQNNFHFHSYIFESTLINGSLKNTLLLPSSFRPLDFFHTPCFEIKTNFVIGQINTIHNTTKPPMAVTLKLFNLVQLYTNIDYSMIFFADQIFIINLILWKWSKSFLVIAWLQRLYGGDWPITLPFQLELWSKYYIEKWFCQVMSQVTHLLFLNPFSRYLS